MELVGIEPHVGTGALHGILLCFGIILYPTLFYGIAYIGMRVKNAHGLLRCSRLHTYQQGSYQTYPYISHIVAFISSSIEKRNIRIVHGRCFLSYAAHWKTRSTDRLWCLCARFHQSAFLRFPVTQGSLLPVHAC